MTPPGYPAIGSLPCRRWTCAWLLALVLLILQHASLANQGGKLSPQTYQRLNTIHGLVDAGKTTEAIKSLQELLAAVGQRRYERAVVLQNLGHVRASRGEYQAAIEAFDESLSLGELPQNAEQQMRYNLSQLYLVTDSPARAVTVLEAWFELADSPPADAWLLLGHTHGELGDYRQAVPAMQRAIELADSPPADWYENLLAMHYELHSYRDCAALLRQMIRLFPDRDDYWQQLTGIYMTMEQPARALAVMELVWRAGRLTAEADLIQLARLYLYEEIPYKAARLLEDAMQAGRITENADNRTLLATAWALARERDQAIRSSHLAAQASTRADVDFTLAQLYLEDERWTEATRALETALAKPGLKTPGTAWLLLGIARYELGSVDAARDAFTKASGFTRSRKSAHQWLSHLEQQS
jgi:tetratricopeptide (TPR) repeat protein